MNERIKILVVDDERDTLDLFRDLFTKKGYGVVCAQSGAEALALVEKEDVDIILLDIKMPVMNGIEALAELKQTKPQIPVVMLTAYGYDDALIEKTLSLGASGYISKDLSISKIFATFWTILGTIQNKQETPSQ